MIIPNIHHAHLSLYRQTLFLAAIWGLPPTLTHSLTHSPRHELSQNYLSSRDMISEKCPLGARLFLRPASEYIAPWYMRKLISTLVLYPSPYKSVLSSIKYNNSGQHLYSLLHGRQKSMNLSIAQAHDSSSGALVFSGRLLYPTSLSVMGLWR